MKLKIIIPIATALFGLLLGYLFFHTSSSNEEHKHQLTEAENQVWTCSMHPQIRRSEPGDCPICGMDLIPLSNEGGVSNPMAIKMSPTAMQLANVQTALVKKGIASKTIKLNGKVKADERYVSSQTTHISGRVEKLLVNYTGETVQKGQVLAYIYSPELIAAQKELFEAQKLLDLQPQLFESAKMKLSNWKLTDSQIDKIITSNKIIENFPIRADRSGVVISKTVNLGDYLNQGNSLYEIADLSRLWIWLDLYERDLNWIKTGSKVAYQFQSYRGEKREGVISFIEPTIDPQTRTSRARIDLRNSSGKYKPEMFVKGEVQSKLSKHNEEITVPKSAVMWTGERSIVYVKMSDEVGTSFMLREIVLGESLGEDFVVKKGLEEGEEIVVNGTFSVDAAAQLAGKPSMMNPTGGKVNTGHNHGGGSMEQSQVMESKSISPEAQSTLAGILDAYLALKNDLVNDDYSKSEKSMKAFQNSLSRINMSLFKGDNHNIWMKHSSALEKLTKNFLAAEDIGSARDVFILISEQMIMVAKSFPPNKELFVQYCPMADRNNGARWLSESKVVKNPYFGEAMLKCGEVTEELHKQ
jgi:Cu(I)/Ag(I) efflux system membrane fusion protein